MITYKQTGPIQHSIITSPDSPKEVLLKQSTLGRWAPSKCQRPIHSLVQDNKGNGGIITSSKSKIRNRIE